MKRLFQNVPEGGGSSTPSLHIPLLDPATLTWASKWDARIIAAPPADGASLLSWDDSSGNGRNAVTTGAPPTYRATGSDTGGPIIDFGPGGVAKSLRATFPASLPATNGFTFLVYYKQTVNPPTGVGNVTLLMSNGSQFFLEASFVPATGATPRPSVLLIQSQIPRAEPSPTVTPFITLAPHVLAMVCPPPQATGRVQGWYDNQMTLAKQNTSDQPAIGWNTNVGTPVTLGNFGFLGLIGFAGIAAFAMTPTQVVGVGRYLRQAFG